MIPDTYWRAPGGTAGLYTFAASNPGTFLYEAGLIPGAQHQVAMGLYGALIVRSATAGQAYDSASTAFDEEDVVVLSEYDTALAANPSGLRHAQVCAQVFPDQRQGLSGHCSHHGHCAGMKVLLRYVNAGLQAHAMSLLGFSQTVIAADGSPFTYSAQDGL